MTSLNSQNKKIWHIAGFSQLIVPSKEDCATYA